MWYVHFLHFYCYGMRSAMLQINEYDDDDDDHSISYRYISQSHAANHHRLMSHVTLPHLMQQVKQLISRADAEKSVKISLEL